MLGVHLCFNMQWIEWFIYLKQDYVLNQMEPHKNLNQTLFYSIIFVFCKIYYIQGILVIIRYPGQRDIWITKY